MRFCVIIGIAFSMTTTRADDENAVRAAIVGSTSNVASLDHYICRYKVMSGVATSRAEAEAATGKITRSFEAIAVRNGQYEFLEVLGPNSIQGPTNEQKKNAKNGIVYVEKKEITNEKFFRNGRAYLSYDAVMLSMHIHLSDRRPVKRFDSITYSPLYTWYQDLGFFSPGELIQRAERYRPVFLGSKVKSDTTLYGIRFEDMKYPGTEESWLDPKQGYLPVEYRKVYTDTNVTLEGTIKSTRRCLGGLFFPMDSVIVESSNLADQKEWLFTRIFVTELDTDPKEFKSAYTSTFLANTQVWSPYESNGLFYLKQDERLSPEDLDELFDKLEKSVGNPRMDTAIEHTGGKPRWWVWPSAIAGGLLILLGVWLWWRKRSRAKRASA